MHNDDVNDVMAHQHNALPADIFTHKSLQHLMKWSPTQPAAAAWQLMRFSLDFSR